MKRTSRRDEGHLQEQRHRVASEAARLIAVQGLRDYHQAKLKAARQLGFLDESSLPRNAEVQSQLREYQRLFQGDQQPLALRLRREAALEAMQFFGEFEPRLVGSVLDGTAGDNSPVLLHAFSDDPDAFARFLQENDLPATSTERRLRVDREQARNFPAWSFVADGLPFEVTVLPMMLLQQPPLGQFDDKAMPRTSLAALRALIQRLASAT